MQKQRAVAGFAGQRQIVHNHHYALARVAQRMEKFQQFQLVAHVQIGHRLVEQQVLRALGDEHGQIRLLTLAAGERAQLLRTADLQKGFSWLPGNYFFENLKNVANDGSFPMFKGILNSLIVSSASAALCTYFSALTAYGLYAYNFKLRKFAFTFIMGILVMPTQVTAMGFLRLVTNMGLYDTLWPLIIPSIASPSIFYFMYSYLKSSLPLSLVEAARIDGSGEFHTFNRIVLPIMKPAIAVQAIFSFVGSWNNYFVPALIIQSKDKMTVPILIATLRGADYMNFDMGKIYMMIMVAIVPIILVYLLLSKYIIAGITLGGVKE